MELIIFLFFLFLVVILIRKVSETIKSKKEKRLIDAVKTLQSPSEEVEKQSREYKYALNDSLLTPAEIQYYKHLDSVIDGKVKVFSKVRLLDVFTPKDKDAFASMRKISSKHVDFLLCEKDSFKPLVAIELDDSSHRSKQSQERDLFVNSVFKMAGLTLHRVECKNSYSESETKSMLSFL
ncbi:DUF2726 domain-containing protein [Planctobacterium marinum]|uniref:DUF2726 domain-containing protein n=1 Tax=Planctobacterium marinum TaxID=1631968 RepID=A0AA48KTZ9_9ALTE|nr:hypothetical protein MACH26_35950 [Planctobacterium marinum]